MAPVQKLGNIDLKKRTSQRFAFGFFTLIELSGRGDLVRDLRVHHHQRRQRDKLGLPDESPGRGNDKRGNLPGDRRNLLPDRRKQYHQFPIGIMSGIYMNEYATNGKLIRFIRIMTNNLSGVPSVVFGLFGMSLFVSTLGWGDSIIAGSFTLALMSLPLIIRTTEEALKSIDDSFRHGSLALGATKLQTIRRVVLPMAFPNIITGLILSIGRVSGETAPILFTVAAYFLPQLPKSIFDQCMALPYHLYVISTSGTDIEASRGMAYGTALVLIVIVLLVNLLANALRSYFAKKVKMN